MTDLSPPETGNNVPSAAIAEKLFKMHPSFVSWRYIHSESIELRRHPVHKVNKAYLSLNRSIIIWLQKAPPKKKEEWKRPTSIHIRSPSKLENLYLHNFSNLDNMGERIWMGRRKLGTEIAACPPKGPINLVQSGSKKCRMLIKL